MRVLRVVGLYVAVAGCGGATQSPTAVTPQPEPTPTLSPADVAQTKAWRGDEGLLIEVVDLTDGGALLRVSGVLSEVTGKVFSSERTQDGSSVRYWTPLHGREWNLLVGQTHGGGTRWTSYAPGAPRGGYPVSYDEEASPAVDVQALYATHVAQTQSGELAALARFDRPAEQAQEEDQLAAELADLNEACGAKLSVRPEWSTVSDEQLRDKSISGYCGSILSGLEHVCRFEAGKTLVQNHVKSVTCRFDGEAELTLKQDELTWSMSFETVNLQDRAREQLLALQPPGEPKALDAAILIERSVACVHQKTGRTVLLGPDETPFGGLAYGGDDTYAKIPTTPMLGDGWFFDPRQRNEKNNPNFRGLDLRVYSHVEPDAEAGTCTLTCGTRETQLALLPPEPKAALLAKATYEPSPFDREPYALARDKRGIYYYVDRGRTPETAKDYHLYRGKRGRLVRLTMRDTVSDSEGEIFESPNGKLRLHLDRKQAAWIAPKQKQELTRLPLADNYGLIYNELGVYLAKRLGVPCDDF